MHNDKAARTQVKTTERRRLAKAATYALVRGAAYATGSGVVGLIVWWLTNSRLRSEPGAASKSDPSSLASLFAGVLPQSRITALRCAAQHSTSVRSITHARPIFWRCRFAPGGSRAGEWSGQRQHCRCTPTS